LLQAGASHAGCAGAQVRELAAREPRSVAGGYR
jgi:hypothetical protein